MRKVGWLKALMIIVVLAIVGVTARSYLSKIKPAATIKSDSYYAVFLTNEQVYFGHLSNLDTQYLTLSDIYYFKLSKPLQSADAGDQAAAADDSKSQLSLIKLGQEVHGPQDEMRINRDNVLFYEELRSDSGVVQTIAKTKSAQK